jgi:hypothetical protein
LPQHCDGTEGEARWRAGLTVGGFSTTINFQSVRADLAEQSVIASLGHHFGTRFGLMGALGAIVGGHATTGGVRGDVGAGVVASATASWLAIYEGARTPFLLATFTLGGSRTTAVTDDGTRAALSAFDGRVAVLVGKSFGPVVPALGARAFGGPVSWRAGGESVVGGDVHHYGVGGSLTVRLPARCDLFAEAMPFGERSLSAGLTYSF